MKLIYAYYKGKIYQLTVRETPKMFVFDYLYSDEEKNTDYAFNYARRFLKSEVCTSPKQAIQREKNHLITALGIFQDRADKAKEELKKVEELEKKINEL